DRFVAAEGAPEVVQFSGGEPTIHPDIVRFVEMARERGVRTVMLNTNGIRLARDDAFMADIARVRPHIYLQFDGLEPATHLALRGRDLREDKQRALDRCAEAGVRVTLVAAVERGVNEHELGAIVRFGVSHPAVNSVMFQPVTHSGRHRQYDPMQRVTNDEVVRRLAEQLPEWYRPADFVPVPCCFPTCRSMSYGFVDDGEVVPFTRIVDVDQYLDYVSNRFLPDPKVREALEQMFSASAVPGVERGLLECDACAPAVTSRLSEHLAQHVFVVATQDFQDAYTLNVRQLMKCCVAEIVPDGRLIPFCAYNSVGYREQVRAQLSGVPVAAVVPNAITLEPLLLATAHGSRTVKGEGGAVSRDARNVGRRLPS
ncbi:MAG: radical SAM protein, partial [Chloroflexota bacterium]